MKRFFLVIILGLLMTSCARVGAPVGGSKDTIPPNFLSSNIDTTRINVPLTLKELRINFDEYVTLKDIQKNLVISPPIKKLKKIYPSNLATKFVSIQWEDTLKANTTYNFNFGNSIVDFNESNPLRYFNFAFSTGEKIDDLYISGEIKDPLQIKSSSDDKPKVVGLYQEKDSIDYAQKPYYIAKVDEDGYYELNYLSPGSYRIIAFEDENGNSTFDQGKEKVGFLRSSVLLEKSISGLNFPLYSTNKTLRYKESKEVPGGVMLLFEGNPENIELKSLSEKLSAYKVTHAKKSDSVYIWFDAKKQNLGIDGSETLNFSYQVGKKSDTIPVTAYRYNAKNQMSLENPTGNLLAPKSDFKIASNYFIENIQTEKWTLKVDSITSIPFTAKISTSNPFEIAISAQFEEGKKYQLTVPKASVFSFYDSNAVSKRFDFEADKFQNYGSFKLRLKNKPTSKFWVQLLDSNEKIVYNTYTNEDETSFNFVKPGNYFVRILVDNNGNKEWDKADFSTQTFAEDAYLYHKIINSRPLWENVEDWDLSDKLTIGVKQSTVENKVKTPSGGGFSPLPKNEKPKLEKLE